MALRCYSLQPGGLLVIEAVALGMVSPAAVFAELHHNVIILLLVFGFASSGTARSCPTARIARLKHTFGMHRTRYRGRSGVTRCAYWAGIANNLMAIGRHGG